MLKYSLIAGSETLMILILIEVTITPRQTINRITHLSDELVVELVILSVTKYKTSFFIMG